MLAVFYITLMKKTNKYTRLSVACVFQKKLYSGEKRTTAAWRLQIENRPGSSCCCRTPRRICML
ncbi:hypothetical protein E7734_19875 [Salmonella enterica subsp. enterica serovar Kentucky]|nr:hypothetical protein [Salmonella enterica subsp. enterica serovar Kentucky]